MTSTDKLCIFHIDLNYSCLHEDYLRKWLKKISNAGYNAILWEIEDKVQVDTCPECIWPEALTKEQFKNILDYSKSLGLEPIPLLQTVGHGEYILMHEEYSHLRESTEENHHDCYCTENPEARKFLKKMIREYLELFGDIRYFHLGGDEAYVFATCPECSAKATQIGKNALYMEHVADLSEAIRDAGARPGIWSDMVLHYPKDIGAVPKDYIIWDWNYQHSDLTSERANIWGEGYLNVEELSEETKRSFPEIIKENGELRSFYTAHALKRMGYEVILCSAIRAAGDSTFFPDVNVRSGNAVGAARVSADLDLLGNCVTSWALRLNSYETQEPLIPLAPEVLRNPDISLSDAESLISKQIFGLETTNFFDAIKVAGRNTPPFLCIPTMAVQWNNLKDSLPAPPNYLKTQLLKWKTEDNGAFFDSLKECLQKAEHEIQEALSLLSAFTIKAEKGFNVLESCLEAMLLQFWMIRATKMIFENHVSSETSELLERLKEKYLEVLSKRETPRSANKNANLVFDWLLEYCQSQATETRSIK
jgi:glycosyl hydrolase family 20